MGEAKRKKEMQERMALLRPKDFHYAIDLHSLPPVSTINGRRIRELTGDESLQISDTTEILLQTFRAAVGERAFHVGFCIGDETGVSAIGLAVIERLLIEVPEAALHVIRISHEDIAWDIVLRHLRSFAGKILLFTFSDPDVYDAGTAELYYSNAIHLFNDKGNQQTKLTAAQRQKIQEEKAAHLGRPPPKIYANNILQTEVPWIFRIATPAGKEIRTAVWNGRRDYAHDLPEDIIRWVGGDKIAIVQVDKPVGVNRRSSLNLTHTLAKDFDGVIHWARNTETFESILKSFIRLDLQSVSMPELPEGWAPKVTILAANSVPNDEY